MSAPGFSLSRRSARLALLALGAFLWTGCSDVAESPTGPDAPGATLQQVGPDVGPVQDLGTVRAVARERGAALMAIPGVVGTGVGLNAAGRPVVKVFLAHDRVEGIPERLGDVPVTPVVTGLIVAGADRTGSARPAHIGFSVGHPDITAGTLGARVTDGSRVLILSNNHVMAASNGASIGDPILQPGAVDGGTVPGDVIGTLTDYQTIRFDGSANLMDAAVAEVDPADVSGITPADEGYGAPGTTVVDASLGLAVQKYGRTTGHTFGQVAEIDVTVEVCYEVLFVFCLSSAIFENQVGISDGSFSAGGDSGSLIVTSGNGNNPVALLFAGGDTRTFANPIGPVLDRFGVTIDPTEGDGGGVDPGDPLSASFSFDCTGLSCTFDASGSTGAITSYAWDFGDGTTGSGASTGHTYADDTGSPYTVELTVMDGDGATDVTTRSVTVSAPSGGNEAPAVVQFDVTTRGNGPWNRADVVWSVSDADGDLAQVTIALVDANDEVLTEDFNLVSGGQASGTSSLRLRGGNPAAVVIIVSDLGLNITMDRVPF